MHNYHNFLVPFLFLAYNLFKLYKNNMDLPVQQQKAREIFQIFDHNHRKNCIHIS